MLELRVPATLTRKHVILSELLYFGCIWHPLIIKALRHNVNIFSFFVHHVLLYLRLWLRHRLLILWHLHVWLDEALVLRSHIICLLHVVLINMEFIILTHVL